METSDSRAASAPAEPARSEHWKRGLIMLAFMFAFGAAQSILYLIAIAQFVWLLIEKEPNRFLSRFGQSLAIWLSEVAKYLSCATDEKPFPWMAWPTID